MAAANEWAAEMAVFMHCMEVFSDYSSSEEEVAKCVTQVAPFIRGPQDVVEQAKAAFGYWRAAFERARACTCRDDIKAVAREYVCTRNPHASSKFNIAQGLMKATIHVLWKKLYLLETRRGHAAPREAILDAVTDPQQRAIQYFRSVLAEIAAERGETLEKTIKDLSG